MTEQRARRCRAVMLGVAPGGPMSTMSTRNGAEGASGGEATAAPKAAATAAAATVARHLNWRRGDPKGDDGSGSGFPLAPDEDDGTLLMEQQGDTLVIAGDVDLHQVAEFRECAEAHITASAQPRLDMGRVPFLDSAGLATLLALSRLAKSQGKELRLIVTGSPRRVLKITGIDRVLVLED